MVMAVVCKWAGQLKIATNKARRELFRIRLAINFSRLEVFTQLQKTVVRLHMD